MATRLLLVLATTLALSALAHSKELELPSQRLGPQFFYIWTEEQLFTAEQALTTMATKNYDGVLAGNAEMQERYQKIIDKLHYSPTVTWPQGVRRHIQFTMGQQILMFFSASRYHCRQTHDSGNIRWGDQMVEMPDEYWGEDDSVDENENPVKVSPAMCDYYNDRAEALMIEMREHKMRSFGGYPIVALPWWMLDWAVSEVTRW